MQTLSPNLSVQGRLWLRNYVHETLPQKLCAKKTLCLACQKEDALSQSPSAQDTSFETSRLLALVGKRKMLCLKARLHMTRLLKSHGCLEEKIPSY